MRGNGKGGRKGGREEGRASGRAGGREERGLCEEIMCCLQHRIMRRIPGCKYHYKELSALGEGECSNWDIILICSCPSKSYALHSRLLLHMNVQNTMYTRGTLLSR